MTLDWVGLLAVVVALAGLMTGLFRWFVGWAEKRHAEHEERWEKHETRLEHLARENRDQENAIRETRERMQRDFIRRDMFTEMQQAIDKAFDKVDIRFDKATSGLEMLHERLSGIARDLNQLIGQHQKDE